MNNQLSVTDKLSVLPFITTRWIEERGAKLDELFSFLSDEASAEEKNYRPELFSLFNQYMTSRYEFGRILSQYWFWCKDPTQKKSSDQQKANFGRLCAIFNLQERTGYRMLEDYTAASSVKDHLRDAAFRGGYDLAEKKYRGLVLELRGADQVVPADPELAILKADNVFSRALTAWDTSKAKSEEPKERVDLLIEYIYSKYVGQQIELLRKDLDAVKETIGKGRNYDWIIKRPKLET